MYQVTVGGFSVSYRREGAGPEVLLLHGALADSRSWRPQMEEMARQFTVVAWDAPGCGQSSNPPEDFSLADFADCCAEFIIATGLEKPVVVGHSFGGGLALELYHRHPHLVHALVLASAYAGWAGSLSAEEVKRRLENGLRESTLPPEDVVRAWMPSLFAAAVPDDVVKETAAILADFHPAGMRAMLRAFAKADLRGALPGIRVPALLLHGEQDRRSPVSVAQALHRSIPGSELVVIPGAGHSINAEAPLRFNAELRRFLWNHPR